MLSELLDLARRNAERAEHLETLNRTNSDRFDRSVGGSVISFFAQPDAPEQHGVEMAIGRSVISSPGSYAAKDIMTSPIPYATKDTVDRSVSGSVVQSSPPLKGLVDRSVGGSILQSAPTTPRGLVERSIGRSIVISPSIADEDVQKVRSPSSVAAAPASPPEQELQPKTILLTPPPNEPLSPGSMTDAVSYLSSHYSDELELQEARAPSLTRVPSSWPIRPFFGNMPEDSTASKTARMSPSAKSELWRPDR